jgi:hypothetical protein
MDLKVGTYTDWQVLGTDTDWLVGIDLVWQVGTDTDWQVGTDRAGR